MLYDHIAQNALRIESRKIDDKKNGIGIDSKIKKNEIFNCSNIFILIFYVLACFGVFTVILFPFDTFRSIYVDIENMKNKKYCRIIKIVEGGDKETTTKKNMLATYKMNR